MANIKLGTWLAGVALSMAALCAGNAAAQDWPARPVKVLVPSAAGGASDQFARMISEKLSVAFKQPFVVENRPGASGMLVTQALATAQPDGYTLALSFASAIVPLVTMQPNAPYNWTHLQPIARFGAQGVIIVVTPDVPARNLKELAAWVKANPGKTNYASYGMASGGHIVMEALKNLSGMDSQHIPYQGVPKILTDMVGGQIKIGSVDPATPVPLIRQGSVIALGTNGHQRLPSLPDVPTMAEQGFPIFMESWYGFFGPKDMPRAIVNRINAEVANIINSPEVRERFRSMNLASTPPVSPDEFTAFIRSEVDVWGKVIKDNGIKRE